MRRTRAHTGRPRRRSWSALALAVAAALTTALMLVVSPFGPGATSGAAGQTGAAGEPTAQTDASAPAFKVTMIGASPLEAPSETWGIGEANQNGGSSWVVLRYAEGSGWSLGPGLLDAAGQPLAGFRPDAPRARGLSVTSQLAGQMTASGDGMLVGTAPTAAKGGGGASGIEKVVLVRDRGGAFRETASVPAPPAEGGGEGGGGSEAEAPLLEPGETLFGAARAPLIAPLEEAGGGAGALVIPVAEGSGVENGVLHWDGNHWAREPIEIPKDSETEFRVLAIGASSPSNAWLLGQLASNSHYPPGAVALFHRRLTGAEGPSWQPVAPVSGGAPGEALSANGRPFTVPGTGSPPTVLAQVLTVTSEGVWIDGERADVSASTTMFFKPTGEGGSGQVLASWCDLPAGAPSGTPSCDHELPEPLPTGPSRSIAWANPATPDGLGERVITGLSDGVSLRLDGTSFTPVLALGGSNPPNDVGGTYGAAFSTPREGWLGQTRLPVHLTLHPAPSRLAPWPTAFRHALVAIAPQPGAPVGSLASKALAVGDQGEVARYEPGKGWMPESLLDSSGRVLTPRLRAVAWPTPSRAYAVGDLGQMWLWKAETGLWEQDPATPFNFRGNLLSVAFDPNNPERGYAVGQGGLLLGYGKTWTQEALPPQAAGATFTSVAFAGSEAIAAYHELPDPSTNRYTGGLLVNDGSGWQVDQGAVAAMGVNVPWAVAGLADGGAAFTAGEPSGSGFGGLVFERSGPGAPWQQTPTPLPGGAEPGSLALFREGGALRAIASGSVPNTYSLESLSPPPAGFPPNLVPPYPLSAEYGAGHVVRQTAGGWSDEEHELNNVQEPPGHYAEYDLVYRPDPVAAVLVDASGTEGWAVGGFVDTVNSNGALDTADVERYPADGVTPPGVGIAPVAVDPGKATFAIGGGAQCAAPCADLASAGIGPDVWLSSALSRAAQIQGARAFLYTGPRATTGATAGPATLTIPYAAELTRYAQILGSSPIPAFAAASPTDLDGALGEGTFAQAFSGLPQPLGNGPAAGRLSPAGRSSEQCAGAAGCQAAYYALDSTGPAGTVRVIVLDDSIDVGKLQRDWLAAQLQEATLRAEPAIVLGNANLNAQIAGHDVAAAEVAQILVNGGASAYVYDAPEQNVKRPLRVGAESIPTFGSGTLGYVNHAAESQGGFLGASGFLLGQVDIAARDPRTNRAPVGARLIPNIAELALEAENGTLLRRSQAALFDALARRPRAGNRSQNQAVRPDTDPYIPIPSNCVGTACSSGVLPEYTFSSSRPDIGDFVEPNLASANPRAVALGPSGKPIPDPSSSLFCAYNAGTTIVTISTGGLSASLPVTVQAGSVRRPCGTTPLKETAVTQRSTPAKPPVPAPTPAPAGAAPAATPPVLPVPPVPPLTRPAPPPALPAPFFLQPAPPVPLTAFVIPPLPLAARPAPPTGSSFVTSPVGVAEEEEEEEEATESASAQAAAYSAPEHEPWPAYVLGAVLLAAFAGASAFRRPRGGRREVRVAPATISTIRAQRRMAPRSRRPW
jgi:hypothetical protein